MIEGVGQSGFAKAVIDAAKQSMARNASHVDGRLDLAAGMLDGLANTKSSAASSFEAALTEGIAQADRSVKAAEGLPTDLLVGRVSDFHEVAGQLKESELIFKFSLEVRNKLIDAYRETMRLSV